MYRTAIFSDVDNAHSCLRDLSLEAATEFVKTPSRWLDWLSHRGDGRSFLMRVAYVNPSKYSWVREDFLRAGFRVAECPSLTGQGKSAADIHIALDVVDALKHPADYNEFVIVSSDADFTPLLRRIREHGRRTVVVAPGASSKAYLGCADEVISGEDLVREAFGMEVSRKTETSIEELLSEMAAKMVVRIKSSGDMTIPDLPRFFRTFPAFTADSRWLGFGSVRRLVEAIAAKDPAIQVIGGERADWRVAVAPEAPAESVTVSGPALLAVEAS